MSARRTARTCLRLAMLASFLAAGLLLAACGSQLGARARPTSSWTRPSGPVGQLLAVSCPSREVCFATGEVKDDSSSSSIVANYSPPGVVLKTTDGGGSWAREVLPDEAGPISAISCWSATHCIAVGSKPWRGKIETFAPGALVIETSNGGRSWAALARPSGARDLVSVACPSATLCVSTGVNAPYGAQQGGAIVVSTDSGVHWHVAMKTASDELGTVSCPSAGSCYVVDISGPVLYASTDGGRRWSADQVLRPSGTSPEAITCPTTKRCLVDGVQGGTDEGSLESTRLIVAATASSIVRYSVVPRLGQFNVWAIACPTTRRCIAVGGRSSPGPYGSALSLQSLDGGLRWKTTATSTIARGYGLNAVACSDTAHCVAVGNFSGLGSHALILATNDFGARWQPGRL